MRGISFGLAIAVTAILMIAASSPTLAASFNKRDAAFLFDGRKVRVEVFRPAGDAPGPAALVLHGASGIGEGFYVYPFAKALAARGVTAFVVRYYDGLGGRKRKASPAIFRLRERVMKAAVDFVSVQKYVLSDRIGVYGMSLGGFHALALGAQDKRIRSVVSLNGAMSSHIPLSQLEHMPPTLILHSGRDRVVPLNRTLKLKRAMEKAGVEGQIKIYKGEGHSLSRRAHADAVESVAGFLSSELGAARPVATSGGEPRR